MLQREGWQARFRRRAVLGGGDVFFRFAPHEVVLVALGFVLPLDQSSPIPLLASTAVKGALAVGALLLTVLSAVGGRRADRLGGVPAVVTALLVVYVAVIGLATFTRSLPADRYQLFLIMPIAVMAFIVSERRRAGSWLAVTYSVSALHIVFAVTAGRSSLAFGGVDRLTAGTSAVFLGFESSLVLVTSVFLARVSRSPVFLVLAALSCYTLVAAYSRAGFISVAVSAALLFVLWSPADRLLRFLSLSAAGLVASVVALPSVISVLSANDPDSLSGASGRYFIWQTLLARFDQWGAGYGFAALRPDDDGPDKALSAAVLGLPTENALLQALLMGGLVGAVIWTLFLVAALRTALRVPARFFGHQVALLVPLVVAAFYSAGLSGVSFDWWWLFAAVSARGACLAAAAPPDPIGEETTPATRSIAGRHLLGSGARA